MKNAMGLEEALESRARDAVAANDKDLVSALSGTRTVFHEQARMVNRLALALDRGLTPALPPSALSKSRLSEDAVVLRRFESPQAPEGAFELVLWESSQGLTLVLHDRDKGDVHDTLKIDHYQNQKPATPLAGQVIVESNDLVVMSDSGLVTAFSKEND